MCEQARGPLAGILSLALLCAPVAAYGEVDTIFVVPGSHMDVGFNDTPSRVLAHRVQVIEDAIEAARSDSEFHWTEDAGWAFGGWLQRYHGEAARVAEARRYFLNGQLATSAVWVDPHASAFEEWLALLTLHLDEIELALGRRPSVAILDDSPSYPEALVDALAAAGVRYALIGANMAFTRPLPDRLVRTPFWWESAKGARILVYIDPDSYGAALTPWAIDPGAAQFFDPARFPPGRALLETMETGIRPMLGKTSTCYDAIVVEHMSDDCGVRTATKLPDYVRLWNRAGKKPYLVLSSPDAYFRHMEERYGTQLPVYHGEWGGQWDDTRAGCPVWTWRLREAMAAVQPGAPPEVRRALATAMDHGLGLGPGWPRMFTEEQTLEDVREQSLIFAHAVELALGRTALTSLPPAPTLPRSRVPPAVWREILSDSCTVRLRAGRNSIAPFVPGTTPTWNAPLETGADSARFVTRARIDRSRIPGSDSGSVAVVMEFPLRAGGQRLRIVPEGSPSALAGRYLRGEPPSTVVAPRGIRVMGLPRPLWVRSGVAFLFTLVSDAARPDITWPQVLLVRQSTRCELKDGQAKALPFSALYPGEPEILEATVELKLLP
jgi:hypothetical protein